MKKCSNSINQECNKGEVFEYSVVTETFVRVEGAGSVSVKKQECILNSKNYIFKFVVKAKKVISKHARQTHKFPQKLVIFKAAMCGEKTKLRQYLQNNKLVFKTNRKPKKNTITLKCLEKTTSETKYEIRKSVITKDKSFGKRFCQSIFQERHIETHNSAYKILLSGDVELNPGPDRDREADKNGESGISSSRNASNDLEVITYNCRGLKEYRKLKRVLNSSANIIKCKPLSIIFLQETHLDCNASKKINIMWRGNYALSPGEGGSRGCITLFEDRWQVDEKYESGDGRMILIAMRSEQLSTLKNFLINCWSLKINILNI